MVGWLTAHSPSPSPPHPTRFDACVLPHVFCQSAGEEESEEEEEDSDEEDSDEEVVSPSAVASSLQHLRQASLPRNSPSDRPHRALECETMPCPSSLHVSAIQDLTSHG